LGQTDWNEKAHEAEIGTENHGSNSPVLYKRKQDKRENCGSYSPGGGDPIGIREWLIGNPEFLRNCLVSNREDSAVHRTNEAREKTKSNCPPFLLYRPIKWILWVVWSIPVNNHNICVAQLVEASLIARRRAYQPSVREYGAD
jgi:hypothetical protein